MNPVTGRIHIRIAGEVRELACDMRAVAVLWDEVGDEWATWLTERFAGSYIPMEDGTRALMAAQIPASDLGLALYALLASDRAERRCIESADMLLEALAENLTEAQTAAMLAIAPSFGIEGKGLERQRKRKPKVGGNAKRQVWDWRLMLETALGLMGMAPEAFWRMTLAEWQCMRDGYTARERRQMRGRMLGVSYLLVAQGADADKVRPAKLLGEVDSIDRKHRRKVSQAVQKMKTKTGPDPELLALIHETSGGKLCGDLLAKVEGDSAEN